MIKVPNGLSQIEQELYIPCAMMCRELLDKGLSMKEAIEQTISRFSILISNIDKLRSFLLAEVTVHTIPATGVYSKEVRDKTWWTKLTEETPSKTPYSTRYIQYLRRKPNWSIDAVNKLDTSTDCLMNKILDPRLHIDGESRGMVFGYVQSGKTAHYISLINKAYDAGYRIIIILSGLHNNLRSQTQARIDKEVLGYDTSIENARILDINNPNAIGVGINYQYQVDEIPLQSITTRDKGGDFKKKTLGVSVMPPFIVVTKKNASVLRYIYSYFYSSPLAKIDGENKYLSADYPALIIDDEADQASINTNEEAYDKDGKLLDDFNPTTINGLIRKILLLFRCRAYIGYTATPFANIFIPPKSENDIYGKDLFPKDFIIRAPKSDLYIGAREFFGLANENTLVMPLCRDIIEGKDFLGKNSKTDTPIDDLPDEMKSAIHYFIISVALRNCRGQINEPNTMLIHIVRFTHQQDKLKRKVKEYYENLESFINYGNSDAEDEFKAIWESDYIKTTAILRMNYSKYMDDTEDIDWPIIWNEIKRISRKQEISIYSINGTSKDSLIYENHRNEPYNVIVIGGDKLSRGLTLEGLTISYFTRSSNAYDTLMQMGRWFGFRPGYLDACRLFTTKALYANFSQICMATEDLADQFDFMNEVEQTPYDFGLRVASHPSLLITSRNKLRTGAEIKKDFSCKLSQTRVFDVDGKIFDRNFEAVEMLLESIGTPWTDEDYRNNLHRTKPGNHYFWRGRFSSSIISFFEKYETSASATKSNSKYMADYIRTMNKDNELHEWTVCLINIEQSGLDGFKIAGLPEIVGAGIYRQEDGVFYDNSNETCSIHTMTSADHEYFDYDSDMKRQADEYREKLKNESSDSRSISEKIRRETRKNGLLILYPIADAGELTKARGDHHTPFGFAAVFPDRKGKGNLKNYRFNQVAMENDSNEFYG